ncbi:hydroxyethylthiazole kinase [Halarchaeum nitratireducens]|uniref:Hydroxyethylthiazole kinase n=1 Tax=Halarchaeum nitratireducens TaxID=489913 RepID=A0A830G991_9EURY|nr:MULTISPECIES: hydroxyethylthiazole kinase [Halarchaeum]MBP2249750.1 hydroxyethylthiazole kinase [Halarchaeum solikamskense]GGN10816.1 hydroxyethylthiazole kinase [Halarchaeum nitratireducens]
MTTDFTIADCLGTIRDEQPLINCVTNAVTVNDVANVALHWGGLPVMSDDAREVGDMVAGAQGCLLNMGTVSEAGEAAMMTAGRAANEHGVPLVIDPVGVGATPTRDRVADALVTDLDPAVVKGNYGEITALAGDDADVRGVESVGEYADVAETAVALARDTDAVVVASGETDVVATADAAYEVAAGNAMLGRIVGTGCMLGVTLATFAAALDDAETAALAGALSFGVAGEVAAEGAFGDYEGPASYRVAFMDAVAGLDGADHPEPGARIERVVDV